MNSYTKYKMIIISDMKLVFGVTNWTSNVGSAQHQKLNAVSEKDGIRIEPETPVSSLSLLSQCLHEPAL